MKGLKVQKNSRNLVFSGLAVVLLTVFGPIRLWAQDALFTQFNMVPMHFNPAFAGNTYAPLVHINSRMQWPSIDLAYNAAAVSYDQYFKRYRSGVGVYLFNDYEGQGIYSTFRLEGIYSYNLPIREDHFLKMGLSLALVQNRLNWEKLVFYDQLDPDYGTVDAGGVPGSSTEVPPADLSVLYPDLSLGLLYYSPMMYAGVAVKHGNSPEQGFVGSGAAEGNGLAVRYALMAGGQISFDRGRPENRYFFHPGLLYTRQAGLQQLSLQGTVRLGTIYAGIGYRYAFDNPDAVLMLAGVELGMYTIAYSYDLTVSGLSAGTGGSHELGIRINFDRSGWFDPPYRYSDCFEIFR
jgi:type IX secretion system PorP/SprF family membrane protein